MSTPQHTCCAKIPRASGWRTVYEPCKRRGKVARESKWYCGQHDPVAQAERNEKARAERDARWEAQRKKWKLEQAAPDLYAALEDLVAWLDATQSQFDGEFSMTEMLSDARAALARARGETP